MKKDKEGKKGMRPVCRDRQAVTKGSKGVLRGERRAIKSRNDKKRAE